MNATIASKSENKSSERLEQLGYGDTCRILNYYKRLSEISESVKDVSVQSIHHLLSALIKLNLISSLSVIILSGFVYVTRTSV